MDDTRYSQEGAGTHIWLRYATQYTRDGRTHTIEMSVPVPIGASEELRAQLIREAEVGMRQLVNHIDGRIPTPSQRPAGAAPQKLPNRPASEPAPQTTPQPVSRQPAPARTREAAPESTPAAPAPVAVPPTRPSVGASMPSTLTLTGNGQLQRPQIIRYIREVLGMEPGEVMKILNIKSLFNDIDQGELVERLNQLAARKPPAETNPPRSEATPEEHETREGNETPPDVHPHHKAQERPETAENHPTAAAGRVTAFPTRPAPVPIIIESNARQTRVPIEEPEMEMGDVGTLETVHEVRPVYAFDEEVGPEEDDELEDLDLPPEFAPHELARARDIIENLRTRRGTSSASAARVQVLNNVLGDQISKEQLQELIESIWNVTQLKRLKVEQLEALVSWGKEDNFVNEVEAVLAVLEEERYASGNR